jgi:predicted ester cyclase
MDTTQNKALISRFIDEYQTGGDERALRRTVHPDVVDHSRPPGISSGIDGVREQFDGFRAAFSGFRATVLHQVAEGDLVVTHKVFTGRHDGEFAGVPATGRDVEIVVMDIVRIADDRVVEHWNCVDRLGLMTQLGALPNPPGAVPSATTPSGAGA